MDPSTQEDSWARYNDPRNTPPTPPYTTFCSYGETCGFGTLCPLLEEPQPALNAQALVVSRPPSPLPVNEVDPDLGVILEEVLDWEDEMEATTEEETGSSSSEESAGDESTEVSSDDEGPGPVLQPMPQEGIGAVEGTAAEPEVPREGKNIEPEERSIDEEADEPWSMTGPYGGTSGRTKRRLPSNDGGHRRLRSARR